MPTTELFDRQKRIARYRYKAKLLRKGKTHALIENKYIRPGEIIRAPKSFNLVRGAGLEVGKFLRAVAQTVLVNNQQVILDFKHTEIFHVPGTILLFAELNRIISTSKLIKPVTLIDPYRRRPREVLKQIGIHNLTSDRCDVIPEREDVVYWKATKGNTQSGDLYGPLIEAIAEKANKNHVKQVEVSGLWRSVNEAVANSLDHAYKKPRYDQFTGLQDTKWWMFSQIKDDVFTLAVCDLGCGYRQTINETLPEKFVSQFATSFIGSNRDALAIDTAMEYGRSGTKESNRGKGSRDALSILKKLGDGVLFILSNAGWMRYEYKNKNEISRTSGSLGIDIGGTIVWWNLPLKELENAEN